MSISRRPIPHDTPCESAATHPRSRHLAHAARQRALRRAACPHATPLSPSTPAARSSLPSRHSPPTRASNATSSLWPPRRRVYHARLPPSCAAVCRRHGRHSASASFRTEGECGSGAHGVFRRAVNTSCTCTTNDSKLRLGHSATDARERNAHHTSHEQRVLVCKRTTSSRRTTRARCVCTERGNHAIVVCHDTSLLTRASTRAFSLSG